MCFQALLNKRSWVWPSFQKQAAADFTDFVGSGIGKPVGKLPVKLEARLHLGPSTLPNPKRQALNPKA